MGDGLKRQNKSLLSNRAIYFFVQVLGYHIVYFWLVSFPSARCQS
jgi:hypothetical protein